MPKCAGKRLVLLAFSLLMINLLTACALLPSEGEVSEIAESAETGAPKEGPEILSGETEQFLPADFTFDIALIKERYYYQYLTDTEKEVYAYLYQEINDLSQEILFRQEIDPIVFHKSYYALIQDCPEFFWLNSNMEITTMDKTGNVTKVVIGFDEVSPDEVAEQRIAVEEAAADWLAQIDQSLSEYEQVKKVFETIIIRTDYVEKASYNQDIRSVFLGQQSVCSGYAKAMQYLLAKLEISGTIVSGSLGSGVPHCWNLVRIDGAYYWVDVTQGDAAGEDGFIYYGYLCFDDMVLNRNYVVEKNIELSTMPDRTTDYFQYPECREGEYNYFQQQGRQYDSYDPDVLEAVILEEAAEGSVFGFQFTNQEAFDAAVAALADESLMNRVLKTLIAREGVSSWKYHYGSDPHIYTVYIQL